MFVSRDWKRTEEDDFKLNVLPRLDSGNEAVPIYGPLDLTQHSASIPDPIVGWNIKTRGE